MRNPGESSLRLPVQGLRPAETAKLPQLEPVLHGSLVLGRRIVALLAFRASQGDDVSHGEPFSLFS
jgi:hypothetical protein